MADMDYEPLPTDRNAISPFSTEGAFVCRITNFDGSQYFGVESGRIASAEWSIERYGGYGSFSMALNGTAEEAQVEGSILNPNYLPDFARVEFYVYGVCRYRGFMIRPAKMLGEPVKFTISGFGLLELVGQKTIRKNYAYGQAKDLAGIFVDVATDIAKSPGNLFYDGLQIRSQNIGITREAGKYRDMLQRDTFTKIVDESANSATYGFYHSEEDLRDEYALNPIPDGSTLESRYRPNVLSFKPIGDFNNPDHVIIAPSSVVEAASGESDPSRIVNVGNVTGGDRKNPNLLPNGEFSDPIKSGPGVGNLILNGSFEAGDAEEEEADNWEFLADAIPIGNGGTEGNAFDGSRFAETDHNGEAFQQIRNVVAELVPGKTYVLTFRTRSEQVNSPCTNLIEFYWRDEFEDEIGYTGSGSNVPGDNFIRTEFETASSTWDQQTHIITCPAEAVGFRVRGQQIAGSGSTQGTSWDDFVLYDPESIRQNGWETQGFGDTQITTQSWVYPDSFDDSGYSYYIDSTAEDTDGQDLHIRPTGQARYNINGGQSLRFLAYVKVPEGATSHPPFKLQIFGFDANGAGFSGNDTTKEYPADCLLDPVTRLAEGIVDADSERDWYKIEVIRNATQDERTQTVRIVLRGSGPLMFDCLGVRDSSETTFVPTGPFKIRVKASESLLTAYYTAAGATAPQIELLQESYLTYGEREENISVSSLTTEVDAYAYLARYFMTHGTKEESPRLTIHEPSEIFLPGQIVYIGGEFGETLATQALPIARVRESWQGGLFRVELELNREWRDEASWFAELVDRRLKIQGGTNNSSSSSAGAAASTQGSSGGGTVSSAVDASATVKGISQLSVAPVSGILPIAVGDNDPRNTNARAPTAHAASHATGGSDPITLASLGGYSPSGTTNQTVYFSGVNTLSASGLIANTGTRVGINTTTPSAALMEINDNGSSPNGTIVAYNAATALGSGSGAGAGWGINTVPRNAGERLGYQYFQGRVGLGGTMVNAIRFEGFANEDWIGGTYGSFLSLSLFPNGSSTIAEMLRVNGTGLGVKTTAPNSSLHVGGSMAVATRVVGSGSRTLDGTDYLILAAAGVTITLPTAVGITGRTYVLKMTSAGTLTISTTSSQTIDGSVGTTITVTNGVLTVVSDGSNWVLI